MEDRILNELFRQVDASIDTKHEILIARRPEEPRTMTGKSDFAQKRAGVTEFDTDRRKSTTEETGVVLVEMGLYVRNRWFQFMIYDL